MAHCTEAAAMATGDSKLPRLFIGRILGPLIKPAFLGEKPFTKNSPTAPSMKIADTREFEKEKTKLISIIKRFAEGGEAKCTTNPHPFFGRLTPAQWGPQASINILIIISGNLVYSGYEKNSFSLCHFRYHLGL